MSLKTGSWVVVSLGCLFLSSGSRALPLPKPRFVADPDRLPVTLRQWEEFGIEPKRFLENERLSLQNLHFAQADQKEELGKLVQELLPDGPNDIWVKQKARLIAEERWDARALITFFRKASWMNSFTADVVSEMQKNIQSIIDKEAASFQICLDPKKTRASIDKLTKSLLEKIAIPYQRYLNVQAFGLDGLLMVMPARRNHPAIRQRLYADKGFFGESERDLERRKSSLEPTADLQLHVIENAYEIATREFIKRRVGQLIKNCLEQAQNELEGKEKEEEKEEKQRPNADQGASPLTAPLRWPTPKVDGGTQSGLHVPRGSLRRYPPPKNP